VEVGAPVELADVRADPQPAAAAEVVERGQADIRASALKPQKAFMDGERAQHLQRHRPFSRRSVSRGSG
jgi:hypothetical protein